MIPEIKDTARIEVQTRLLRIPVRFTLPNSRFSRLAKGRAAIVTAILGCIERRSQSRCDVYFAPPNGR
jgi:hypothetical protein